MLVTNNFVSMDGNVLAYGIQSFGGAYHKIYHNSVSLSGASSTSYAFYSQGGTNKDLLNNIFLNNRGGYAIYTTSTISITRSDYNNLFTTGANLGYQFYDRTRVAEDVLAMDDRDGDGAMDIGVVLRDSRGEAILQVRDSRSSTRVVYPID